MVRIQMTPFDLSFRDRWQAAEQLAEKLRSYQGQRPLILGVPRGAVPMAKVLAEKLNGDLDVVLVHKIGAPDNSEYAIGSVSEFGAIYLSEGANYYKDRPDYIQETAKLEMEKLKERRKTYSPIRPPIQPRNRIVIIVDDGIATGSTMIAAVRAVRSQEPRKIIVAAPVASLSALEVLRAETDDCVVLYTPENFFSISQFYDEFPQVEDQEVLKLLQQEDKEFLNLKFGS